MRTWSHIYHSSTHSGHIDFDTTIHFPDTVFSLKVISDSSILFGNDSLYFSPTYHGNGRDSIDLNELIYFMKRGEFYENMYVAYYYEIDSIFIYYWRGNYENNFVDTFRSKR